MDLRKLVAEEVVKNVRAFLETGERFQALVAKFRKEGKTNPEGLAASIGRKKYGKRGYGKLVAAGRKAKAAEAGAA